MTTVDEAYLEELVLCKRSLRKISNQYGISEDKLGEPGLGDYLVEQLKQTLTELNLYKSMAKQATNNGSPKDLSKLNDPELG